MSGKVHVQGGVLHCAVSAADKGSSLDADAMAQLVHALADEPGIGAVLLRGGGANFCTGGDVSGFAAAAEPGVHVRELAEVFHAFLLVLVESPVPVVAAVQGWAAGAGMSIACAADVVVGSASTRFRPAYPALGFTPDGGMSWSLPRIIGAARARDVLLTDRVLDGEQAHTLGLLTRLVADDAVHPEALVVAERLAAGPTGAHRAIRTLLRESATRSLTEQLAAEASSIAACAESVDGREGVRAFAEHRRPRFAPPDHPSPGSSSTR